MRTMLVNWAKPSRKNRSRPSIKPDHRASDQQVIPFKKRARFLFSDDTRLEYQSEKIVPSDDRRLRSRSDVVNTGESKKTEIAQVEKKLSNTANDEVTHASVSPVAIRPSEVPLATSASEEDHVKERERAKTPTISVPSEPQGVFVVDGGIKQVDALKEVTEHECHDGGESTKSGPQGDGGNSDGLVINEKLINQTKDVIQQEGGDDGITGEPQVDGIEADEYTEVMEDDGGNENDINNARDDVNKLHQPEPVTNLDGSSSQSRADTTIKGNNISKETEGGAETTKGKEPVDDVVSTMVVYGGHELVKTALDRVDHGSGGINEAGGAFETTKSKELVDDVVSTMVVKDGLDLVKRAVDPVDYGSGVINEARGVFETTKGKELVVDVVSTMIVEGGRDWDEKALKLDDFRNRAINEAGGNGEFIEQQETVGDVSATLVDNYGRDWEEDIVGYGSRGANEAECEFETNKRKEPVDDVVSAMVVEGGDDWEGNALNLADYRSGGINEIGSEVETSAGKGPIDGGWYEWACNILDVADNEIGSVDVTIGEFETSNVNDPVNDGVSTGVGGRLDLEENAPENKSRGINVIPMIHQHHTISERPSDYRVSAVAVNDGNIESGKQEPEDPYSPIVSHGAQMNPAYPIVIPQGGSGGIDVPLTEEHQKNSNKPIEYIVIESSDSEQELEEHGAPLNPANPIPNPEGGSGGGGGPRGGSLSDQTADRGLYARAPCVIDIPMSQIPMTITSFKKESTNSHELQEGSQDGGSGEAEQNANHTIRFRGFDIPCQKHTAATNTKDGDASGGAAADGSPPMHDSDVLRQQVHPASTGTGDGARNKGQEPLADGRGESSMQRPKAGVRLLGFDL